MRCDRSGSMINKSTSYIGNKIYSLHLFLLFSSDGRRRGGCLAMSIGRVKYMRDLRRGSVFSSRILIIVLPPRPLPHPQAHVLPIYSHLGPFHPVPWSLWFADPLVIGITVIKINQTITTRWYTIDHQGLGSHQIPLPHHQSSSFTMPQ